MLSCVWLIAILWIVARQAPLSMGFFRREHWSGLPFPSSVDLLWHRNQTHISCIGRQIFFTNEPPGKPHSSLIPPSKPLSFPPPSSAFSFSTVSLCKTLLLFFQAYLTITWELSWLNKLLEWLWKVPSVLGFHLSNESIALDSLPSHFQCQGPVTTNKPDLFRSPLFP